MNAVVGLCHFCEAHGPRPLFCTFTTDDERHTTEPTVMTVQCNGCASLNPDTVFVSRDDDGTIFCSRESVPNPDVTGFLRQAAIRSITCEVNWSKDGGVVYFSDTHGHILSYTFQLCDTRARGLKRWFSIVVLMKDKMLLLNITPLLSEHAQKISKELQILADVVFNNEQKICSQRALRLNTGRNDFGQSRSLTQLTGDKDVFKKLHTKFTWMLKAGALSYSETLYTSGGMLKKFPQKSDKCSIFDNEACTVPSNTECIPLRSLEALLTKPVFRILLYCTLVGINIVIKSIHTDSQTIVKGLLRLVPSNIRESVRRIRPMKQNEAINASSTLCVLEETENNNFCTNWRGTLPTKCPTMMNNVESAIINTKFNDAVLHQHIKSLQLQWLGITKAIKSAIESSGAKSEAVVKLKKIFGMTEIDNLLVSYWCTLL